MPRRDPVLLALLATLLAGCASLDPDVCARFDRERRWTRYDTHYRYSEHDTRAAAANFKRTATAAAAARWYTLRPNVADIAPCEHLYLYKEVYLQRPAGDVVFEEIRDFYTAAGQRVATKKEDVSGQLKQSGYYSAAVPLPIPESAPAGGYRVVSRLLMKAGGREHALATASAEFRVRR